MFFSRPHSERSLPAFHRSELINGRPGTSLDVFQRRSLPNGSSERFRTRRLLWTSKKRTPVKTWAMHEYAQACIHTLVLRQLRQSCTPATDITGKQRSYHRISPGYSVSTLVIVAPPAQVMSSASATPAAVSPCSQKARVAPTGWRGTLTTLFLLSLTLAPLGKRPKKPPCSVQ